MKTAAYWNGTCLSQMPVLCSHSMLYTLSHSAHHIAQWLTSSLYAQWLKYDRDPLYRNSKHFHMHFYIQGMHLWFMKRKGNWLRDMTISVSCFQISASFYTQTYTASPCHLQGPFAWFPGGSPQLLIPFSSCFLPLCYKHNQNPGKSSDWHRWREQKLAVTQAQASQVRGPKEKNLPAGASQ